MGRFSIRNFCSRPRPARLPVSSRGSFSNSCLSRNLSALSTASGSLALNAAAHHSASPFNSCSTHSSIVSLGLLLAPTFSLSFLKLEACCPQRGPSKPQGGRPSACLLRGGGRWSRPTSRGAGVWPGTVTQAALPPTGPLEEQGPRTRRCGLCREKACFRSSEHSLGHLGLVTHPL